MRGHSMDGIYLGKLLRQMFPNQTKSPLHVVIWSIVYLVDAVLVFLVAHALGFHIMELGIGYQLRMVVIVLFLLIALGLFAIQANIYNQIFR